MSLSLKIHVPEQNVTKTMQFHSSALVCDVCVAIHDKLTDSKNLAKPKDYGLFVFDEDPKKGAWLEPARNLGYYLLHDGDTLQYRRKMRPLKVRMLDGTVKTIMVDDSQPVANLMVVICTKILITNHDEYSLVREKAEEENEKPVPTTNFGTLTLRRKKDGDREIDPKMEQLKKKLKTEDETVWVDHSKTLREQGIDEIETLLLRRKYFFSDRNIDSHDPVQLNLLYVQCRDAIIDGTHPVTADKACQFAGLQCHIQFGDFVESKHKPGFADVKEFLPQCYTKLKNIEKRIFSEHSNHIGKSEVDTKVEYCKLARELKTYGVSFFLVKEKQKGKNKLVPRLLGVTKDSVLRLDEKTKEILKTWPLTAVKRWGASPNTFTLDFGDYSEKYYSVQTTEGEQISQLISGYIDIILKKKKAKDHFGIEGDEGSSMVEESVSPLRATYVQHQRSEESTKVSTDSISKPALLREANGAQTYGRGHMDGAQFGMTHGTASVGHSAPLSTTKSPQVTCAVPEPQRALISTINAGQDAIRAAERELDSKAQLPELGTDPASMKWRQVTLDTNKQSVTSQIAAMNAATAQVVTLTGADDVDHNAVGAAISTITSNLPEMTRGMKMIAALMDDQEKGEHLFDAARRLCGAFSDLLRAVEPESHETCKKRVKFEDTENEAPVVEGKPPIPPKPDTKRWSYALAINRGLGSLKLLANAAIKETVSEQDDDGSSGRRFVRKSHKPRQHLLNAASRVGDASHRVLSTIEEEDAVDKEVQDILLGLAKAVANSTAALVLKAKNVAATSTDELQNRIIAAATQCALATSQLVACAKVVAPTMQSPGCQDQLMEAARGSAIAVENVVETCRDATSDESLLRDLGGAAAHVTRALNDLLNHIKTGSRERVKETVQEHAVDTILQVSDRLIAATGNSEEMVQQARVLAKATANLIQAIKAASDDLTPLGSSSSQTSLGYESLRSSPEGAGPGSASPTQTTPRFASWSRQQIYGLMSLRELWQGQTLQHLADPCSPPPDSVDYSWSPPGEAEHQKDSDLQKRLLAAAKMLADATTKMVEAAKACASSPDDATQQIALKEAAQNLRHATHAAASTALRKKLIRRLENASKQAAAAATQTIAAAQGAGPHNTNRMAHDELMQDCREAADMIPKLVQGVKESLGNPDNPSAQLNLITAAENFLLPADKLVASSKSALPTVVDQASQLQLSSACKQMASAVTDLGASVGRARDACRALELDAAIEMIRSLDQELIDFEKAVDQNTLRPLPGETPETTSQQLDQSSKAVGAAMAQLLTSASQGDEYYTGIAARETAISLRDLTESVRGVAATSREKPVQRKVVDEAHAVMTQSIELIEEAKNSLKNPADPSNHHRLTTVARVVASSLNRCFNCLPGQKDVDEAINQIEGSALMSQPAYGAASSGKSYSELQTELTNMAAHLNDAVGDVVSTSKYPSQLAPASKKFSAAHGKLLETGGEIVSQNQDPAVQTQMSTALRTVSATSAKLLLAAKAVASDPDAPSAKNQLAAAARAVTDSINHLLDVCTSAAPGQKECDSAIRNIQSMQHWLENPAEPVNNMSYFECLDSVMEMSKSLGDGMTGVANHAKRCEYEDFSSSVNNISEAICGLVEGAAQAAYLVGVSDPSAIAGRPGLVDQGAFSNAAAAIKAACEELKCPASDKQQVLQSATIIAKHTSVLCNSCRIASSKTTNPAAKRQFVQSAKDVANATSALVKRIKELDDNFSDSGRQRCGEAIEPLISAVDSLVTFGSSPEFYAVKAKIPPQARAAQEPISTAGKSIIRGSCSMLESAKLLAVNPKDPPTWQNLAGHSKSVSDAIKKLVSSIRDKAPGQRECDSAIEVVSSCIRELDQASLGAIGQTLPPRKDNSLKGFNEQMEMATRELLSKVDPVQKSAKDGAESLGHAVTQLSSYFSPLTSAAIGAASNMVNTKQQTATLDQVKSVAECALQLLYTAKEGGGNPKATHVHVEINESADSLRDALQDLTLNIEQIAAEAGVVTSLLEQLSKAMSKVDERYIAHPNDSFVDFQTRMVNAAKEIAKTSTDMVSKSMNNVQDLGTLASKLTNYYSELADDSRGAILCTASAEVAGRLRASVINLGRAASELVKCAGSVQGSPHDPFSHRDLADAARGVSEKVSEVLAALQAGSRGTQACINAASTVSGIIGDLDTTIMFATAGTLNPENDEVFDDHRDDILKTAKALVEDTKTLVTGAASSQEQLAVAAQNAVATIVQLADVVKLGAASLGANNQEAQVMLINAVKDVASALGDLIQSTKVAAGKNAKDPAMEALKESAKVMVTNVTSLLKTVKAVQDEHTRGTRALEATIEAIAQEIRAFDLPEPPAKTSTPEELMRATKPVTLATAKAVAAGTSLKQDDIIVAANMGRKAISDLLTTCKGAAYDAESGELKRKALEAGHNAAETYRELLRMVMQILMKPSHEGRHHLTEISRNIAACVQEIVFVSEQLKGSDWVDPDDPNVIAENELLGAALSIDKAAKKLAALRPRRGPKEADDSLNFDEMILEAAKSIAAATSALVKAANSAQRELIEQGKISRRPRFTSDDGQWSEGLISAARFVAAATHSLCEAANALVQGHATEDKLISAAKQVASSTAQLLVACRVKADPDSTAMRRLQGAGNEVKRATDNLVRAAQQAIDQDEERQMTINTRMVGGIAQEIDARSEVFRLEKELEDARNKFALVKKAKYRVGQTSDSEGDLSGLETSFSSLSVTPQRGAHNFQQNILLHSTPTPLESPQQVNQVIYHHHHQQQQHQQRMMTSVTSNGEFLSESSSVAYTQLMSPMNGGHNGHVSPVSGGPPPPPPMPTPSQVQLRTTNRPNFNKTPKPFEPYQSSGLERQDSFKREPDSPSGIVEQPLLNVMKGKSIFEASASSNNSSSFSFNKSQQ